MCVSKAHQKQITQKPSYYSLRCFFMICLSKRIEGALGNEDLAFHLGDQNNNNVPRQTTRISFTLHESKKIQIKQDTQAMSDGNQIL